MTSNGYIKLHRKLLDWGWYKDPNTKAVFLHLLLTANYTESEYMGVKIHPGQTVIGRKALAKTLGMSERNVRTALTHLKMTNEVTIKVTNKFSVVTIVGWEKYQLDDEQPTNKLTNKMANNRPASDHTIRKEESKNRESAHAPTYEDVKNYVAQMGYKMNPAAFYDYYESTGWLKKNGQRIRDWKASVRTWERREKQFNNGSNVNGNTKPIIEPPKYKQFGPEPKIDAVQMPDDVRAAVNKILK